MSVLTVMGLQEQPGASLHFRSIKPVHITELLSLWLCLYRIDKISINTLWTCSDDICKTKSAFTLHENAGVKKAVECWGSRCLFYCAPNVI